METEEIINGEVIEDAEVIDGDLPPTKRVKMVAIIQRFGTRAQKRAVAAGRATRVGLKESGKWAKNQITQPYSTTKSLFVAMGLGMAIGGMFLVAMYAAMWAAVTFGALWITFLVAFFAAVLYQLAVLTPIAMAVAKYNTNAEEYYTRQAMGPLLEKDSLNNLFSQFLVGG